MQTMIPAILSLYIFFSSLSLSLSAPSLKVSALRLRRLPPPPPRFIFFLKSKILQPKFLIMLLPLLLLLLSAASPQPLLEPNSSQPAPNPIAASRPTQCLTGNPIDDCWLCSPADRFRLADCAIGFGRSAIGGKNGCLYTVTDPSDSDPANPIPGTLRHAAIQISPLWIIFSTSMSIQLKQELLVNSFKTIDARGVEVHIAGGACIAIRNVSNVIIHNLHIHDCVPAGDAVIRSSPIDAEHHGKSDGDGISIISSQDIWIDHCALSSCADGLIDVTRGSTRVTISNNFFSRHDKVMLLGHSDDYTEDSEMQVTVAYNRFGEKLVQRMPRCRHGFFHIVNNDYTEWEMYAVGGSANPTINSQGNRYTAPADPNNKEVTKRIDTAEEQWSSWNWRSDGDIMANGAFFVPSGDGSTVMYEKASSVEAKPAELIDQLTLNAGVLGKLNRDDDDGQIIVGGGGGGVGGGGGLGDSKFPGMGFSGGAPPPLSGIKLLLPLSIIVTIIIYSV